MSTAHVTVPATPAQPNSAQAPYYRKQQRVKSMITMKFVTYVKENTPEAYNATYLHQITPDKIKTMWGLQPP